MNTEIYEMKKDAMYSLKLMRSLRGDGNDEEFDLFKQANDGTKDILDDYQYVMYGKIFEEQLDKDNIKK